MASVTLSTRYRPVRIGFCIPEDDLLAALAAMDLAHTLWGGRFCPIIPCNDQLRALRLVAAFGVDALFPVTKHEAVTAFISNRKSIEWPFPDPDFFCHDGSSPQLLTVAHPIRKLRQRRQSPTQYPTIVSLEWEEDDALAPWFSALVGRFPGGDSGDKFRSEFRRLWPKTVNMRKDAIVPADLMHQIRLNSLTSLDLDLGKNAIRSIYVASGDLFYDIVSFWNLRASGERVAFYDRRYDERLKAFLARFSTFENEMQPVEGDPHIRIWGRDKPALSDTPYADEIVHVVDRFLESSTFPGARFGGNTRSVLGSLEEGDPPLIHFSLPEKPCFEAAEFHSEHLILDITTFHNAIRHGDYLFPPPPVAALNDYYSRKVSYLEDAVRAIPRGISLFVRVLTENTQVVGAETFGVAEQIFDLAGVRITRSRPGLIAKQLIQQMGGLQGCRVFKIPGVRALIEKYNPTQSFVRSEAIQLIRDHDFASHESLFISKRTHKSLTPDDVFEFLLDKEVFRAGLELHCPNCQLPFWQHIDNCATKLPCDYCGKVFNITPQLRHRGDWRFRRSGLFGASNNQEGSVPVALTLQQVETSIHDYPLTYITAVELAESDIRCEADFVVIHDDGRGGVDIVLSECKTRDEISQKDVDNLVAVRGKLSEAGFKVFLLFSKTDTFTELEIDRFKHIEALKRGGTILLSARELEAYNVYERASKEFDVNPYSVALDDMVEATRLIYLDPRRRP